MILLHRKQYIFLKAKEDLTEKETREWEKIGTRLPTLEKAWQLKEALRTWYTTATVADALNCSTLGSSTFNKKGQPLFKRLFLLLKTGGKRFSLFFNFCPHSFRMVLLKERIIESKR
jgi:hypothetical protein